MKRTVLKGIILGAVVALTIATVGGVSSKIETRGLNPWSVNTRGLNPWAMSTTFGLNPWS